MNYYFKSTLILIILCLVLVNSREKPTSEDIENEHDWDYKQNGADWPSKFKKCGESN